jgi:hypothetical protein
MKAQQGPAAPLSGNPATACPVGLGGQATEGSIPDFAQLAADPEIAPLLDFDPVVRKVKRPDGWTPELQRELIARLAATGTVQAAVWQMGKHATGAEALYKTPSAGAFRKCWDAAIIIGRRRNHLDCAPPYAGPVPGIARRRASGEGPSMATAPLPGQMLNELGQWEDEASLRARAEEARESICEKLLRCRRLFLAEISSSPGKRAAFEILTELPVDWDKAAEMQPQPDEPWKSPNQRQPDMVLTAENGWSFGEIGYGEDKKAELRAAVDKYREEEGLAPVNWNEEDAATPNSSSPTEIGDPPSRHSRESGNPSPSPSPKPEDKPRPRLRRV